MAQAPTVKRICELCDLDIFEWKCVECNQHICKKCKTIHLKTAATKNHTVKEIKNVISGSGGYKTTCDIHSGEQLLPLYCNDCSTIVCNKCITSAHKRHAIEELEVISGTKQVQLESYVEHLRGHFKKANDEYAKCLEDSKTILKAFDTATSETTGYVDKILNEIQQYRKIILKSVESAKHEATRQTKNRENEHDVRRNQICNLIREAETVMQSGDKIRLVKVLSLLEKSSPQLSKGFDTLEIPLPKFIPARIDNRIECTVLVGKIEFENLNRSKPPPLTKTQSNLSLMSADSDFAPNTVTTIKHSYQIDALNDRTIGCIAVSGDNEAWIACPYDQNISSIRRNGNIRKQIHTDFNISDIAVSKSGDLLISSAECHSLKMITSSGDTIIDIMNTYPSEPHGISVASNGEILICLTDGDFGHVTRISEKGKIQQEYDTYVYKGQSYLFRKPVRCVENVNGEICILDEAAKRIIILDKTGTCCLVWEGPETSKLKIEPSGLDCDSKGNILVTDYDNSAIYLIDRVRNETETLEIVEKKIPFKDPYGIALHADKFLWVGCDDGFVHVMRYHQNDG